MEILAERSLTYKGHFFPKSHKLSILGMQHYKESFTNKCPVENAVFAFVQ